MKSTFVTCLTIASILHVFTLKGQYPAIYIPRHLIRPLKDFTTNWYDGLVFLNNGDTIADQLGFNPNGMVVKGGLYEKPFFNVYSKDQVIGYRIYHDQNTTSIDYVKVKLIPGFFEVLVRGNIEVLRQDKLVVIRNKLSSTDLLLIKHKKELVKAINEICNKDFRTNNFYSFENALEMLVNCLNSP